MRYTGSNCEVCKKIFEESDDVVVCPVCGTPHHRDCWFENGGCANDELHKDGFQWTLPSVQETTASEPQVMSEPYMHNGTNVVFKNGEQAIECKNCGAPNYANDAFCMKCHAPLHDLGNDEPQGQGSDLNFFDRVYEYNRLFGGLAPDTPVYGIPAAEYSDYIGGKNPGRLIRKFATSERYGKKIIPSFFAFLFGPIWFFYKKMYKVGALIFAVIATLTVISTLLGFTQPMKIYYEKIGELEKSVITGELSFEDFTASLNALQKRFGEKDPEFGFTDSDVMRMNISSVIDYGIYGVRFVCMLFAYTWYCKKIQKDIYRVREESSSMDEYRYKLVNKGGTSAVGAIIGVVISFAISVIAELPLFMSMI